MARYFDRFPIVDYDGSVAKNILARVDFTEKTKRDIYSTFQFTLEEGFERPDLLSYNYYGSSKFDWMIYLTNNIVDPYYDYYKSTEDFKNYMETKYGSNSNARSITLFYRLNWHEDERLITIQQYDSLIADETANARKYWKPKLTNTGAVIGYERIKEEWIVSTNKVLSLSLSVVPTGFEVGDRVSQTSTNAFATIDYIDLENNRLTVKHVSGTFAVNAAEGISEITVLSQNIPEAEAEYWYAVNAYDDEKEANELKRNVVVLKSSYLAEVEKQFIQQIST
jgi:hypothetical protein